MIPITTVVLSADEIQPTQSPRLHRPGLGAACRSASHFSPSVLRTRTSPARSLLGSLAGDVQRTGARDSRVASTGPVFKIVSLATACESPTSAGHLAGYRIGDHVLIENIGVMETRAGARFGNGVEVVALNEAGGREVPLFNALSSQFAYLAVRPSLPDRAAQTTVGDGSSRGGSGHEGLTAASATACRSSACRKSSMSTWPLPPPIDSAQSLVNGTVLSHPDAATIIGDGGALPRISSWREGAHVTGGAIIDKSFVGQRLPRRESVLGREQPVLCELRGVSRRGLQRVCWAVYRDAPQIDAPHRRHIQLLQRRQRHQPIESSLQAWSDPRGQARARLQDGLVLLLDVALSRRSVLGRAW